MTAIEIPPTLDELLTILAEREKWPSLTELLYSLAIERAARQHETAMREGSLSPKESADIHSQTKWDAPFAILRYYAQILRAIAKTNPVTYQAAREIDPTIRIIDSDPARKLTFSSPPPPAPNQLAPADLAAPASQPSPASEG